jgi:alkanesulfonate monooxygenase SsuD/methylene tetrahydromethanopterin reductase-like flavin-dependent oxidoreductase (luciferase family)
MQIGFLLSAPANGRSRIGKDGCYHRREPWFSTIWAPEHVVLLDQYTSRFPYSTGKFPAPPDTPIADPFTTLAYAAACTTKIRLATGICLVPEHNLLVLAKTAATVGRLSDGRFILGAGVGWLAEEFETLGVPFERRGQRTREYIEVMRKLWTERSSSHHGEFVNFTNVLKLSPSAKKACRSGLAAKATLRSAAWPSTATAGLAST